MKIPLIFPLNFELYQTMICLWLNNNTNFLLYSSTTMGKKVKKVIEEQAPVDEAEVQEEAEHV